MTANDYPGNGSLPEEVRQRVMATFRQTVDLYREAKLEEVIVGCDLILEMDDRFQPAMDLRDKALDPSLPVDVENLLNSSSAAGSVNVDTEILSAIEALNRRDFQTAIDICNSVLATDPENAEAQKLGAKAYERLEAAPFVEQFIAQSRDLITSGKLDEARASLEKAKSLDPLHPALKDLEGQLSSPAPASFDMSGDAPSDFASAFSTPSEGSFSLDQGAVASPSAPAASETDEPPAEAFVVETSASAADSPAPAADYGFTFEEEPEGAAKAPEPEVGEAHTFDFSSAAVEVSAEDQSKVQQLLRDGDEAYSRGEIQEAIDIWSRIFLIDVTNEDASAKIEAAKKKNQELQAKVDEALNLALTEYSNKDYHSARKHFEEVLRLDSSNLAATEHLERIAEFESAMQAEAASGQAPITAPPQRPPAADLFDDEILSPDVGVPPSGPFVPPTPPQKITAKTQAATSPARTKGPRVPMAVVGAVIAVVLGIGGWFGYKALFGGGAAAIAETQAVLKQAQSMADQGKFSEATDLLLSVGPDDPLRDRALELIADIRGRQKEAAGRVGGRPAAAVFSEYLAKGRDAYQSRDFVSAKGAFEQAAAIQPLPPEFRQMYDDSAQRAAKLTNATNQFREGNYREAIRSIQSILDSDPDNANAIQMMGDAHFNLGALALREGRLSDAQEEFGTVLELNPDDATARRSRELALRYDGEPQDLLYRIYVKYLPLR